MYEPYELFQLITQASQETEVKQANSLNRQELLCKLASQPIVKQAFDTRRIDQNTQYNPRRNLQYHVRQQSFINEQDESKIIALAKLKEVSDSIRNVFIGEPEWFDSYASDLDHMLNKTFFKADGKNFDFSPTHIQYLEQLLEDRYRLKLADISSMNPQHLQATIIHKDERLEKSNIYKSGDLSKLNKQKQANHQQTISSIKLSSENVLWNLTENIVHDEKKLDNLRQDEISLISRINRKKADLQDWSQEKTRQHNIVQEKIAQEKPVLAKLWSDYYNLQKVMASKKNLEELASVNGNYQSDAIKLIANISNDITLFTSSMHKERPVYDAINSVRVSAEKSLTEKIEMEKQATRELEELQIQANQIKQEREIVKERMKNTMQQINKIRSSEGV